MAGSPETIALAHPRIPCYNGASLVLKMRAGEKGL